MSRTGGGLAIAGLAIKQNFKNPIMVGLLVGAPVVLVFILAEATRNLFPAGRAFQPFVANILTQAAAFAAHVGLWGVEKNRRHTTMARLRVAPIGPVGFLAGTAAGGLVTLWVFLALTGGAMVVLFQVPIEGSAWAALAVLGGAAAFSTALGTTVGMLIADQQARIGIMNFLAPALIALGGGYFPMPESGPLACVSLVSPYRWMNRSLAGHLGIGEPANDLVVVLVEVGAAVALLALAWTKARRIWT
ncbi:MAG: hypothetical protein ACOC2D_02380 [Spirochaetota bacterium]